MKVDPIPKKKDCKWNSIWLSSSSNGKVVFTLLIEVIILHIGPIVIDVMGLGFEFM